MQGIAEFDSEVAGLKLKVRGLKGVIRVLEV